MRTPPHRRRRGYHLVELVLLIGCVTIVLSLCGGFLHVLFRLEDAGRSALADTNNLFRLSREFRRDAHAASEAQGVPEGLDLVRPDGTRVEYRQDLERLLRTESQGGKLLRREVYTFAGLGPVDFKIESGWVRASVARRLRISNRPGYRIEARIGRDRSLAVTEEPKS